MIIYMVYYDSPEENELTSLELITFSKSKANALLNRSYYYRIEEHIVEDKPDETGGCNVTDCFLCIH